MRNPIRLKNLRLRFLPYYFAGAVVLVVVRPSAAGFAVGALVVAIGIGLRTWAAGHLVKNDELTTSGPYAHLRHPLYAGTLLTATGFALIAGGWYTAAVLLGVVPWFFMSYFPRKERGESARLEELYGDGFRAYCLHVPALVPRLRAWTPSGDGRTARSWSGSRYSANNELGTLLAQLVGLGCFGALFVYYL